MLNFVRDTDNGAIPPNISYLTGAQLFGILMNWGLLGVLLVQIYIYYLCFPKDPLGIKLLVYCLTIIEVVQTTLSTMDGFHWFVFGWGDLNVLNNPFASPYDSPFLDSIIATAVQIFFSWRIYKLSKNIPYSVFLSLLSAVSCAGGMAAGIKSGELKELSLIRQDVAVELSIWLISSAVTDTLIAITMTILLLRQKNHLQRTNYVITRIVQLTVETNALTASIAILTLVLFLAFPSQNFFICPPYILGKLYSNTLLVVFNNRIVLNHEQRLRAENNGGSNNTRTTELISFKNSNGVQQLQRSVHSEVRVDVHQETVGDMIPLNDVKRCGNEVFYNSAIHHHAV